ncbi:MAG: suppressor of fused domain protein [Lachnospiraceae bacterium]|nr:suppressor of fused domain protein [Lachnospiraceae bacterium]
MIIYHQTQLKTKVKFYTLVPITEEEEELVHEKGSAAVKKMLSSGDIVDMERELLVEPV